MKVLIFEIWHESPQFETGLELADKHAALGDEVCYVHVGKELPYLEWYPGIESGLGNLLYRKSVERKIEKAKKLLDPSILVSTDSLLNNFEIEALYQDLVFEDLEELKNYTWENIDLGLAAASSHISVTNNLSPDTVREKAEINRIIHSSKIVAASFLKWLEKFNPDLVLFRNGRVATYRPILRICQNKGIEFLIHDRACDKFHYSLGRIYRHDWEMRKDEMDKQWNNSALPIEEKKKIGKAFFEERSKRKDDSFTVFAKHQNFGQLPESWNQENFNVVYFNSSIAEYAAVGDEVNPHVLFDSQEDSVIEIAEKLSKRMGAKFYLRLHPNLSKQSQKEKDIWMNLGSEKIELIKPDSPVDTYTLIREADLVICYLSTVGVEAAFLGKPVICLSRSLYERLNVAYQPSSKQELFDILNLEDIPAKPSERCLEYGFYMKTHGIKHQNYLASTHRKGKYKGVNLQDLDFKITKKKMKRPFKKLLKLVGFSG